MMTDDEAWAALTGEPVAVLATITADGEPRLVPFTFAAIGPRTLLTAVDSKPKRDRRLARIADIRRDSRVTVLAHHYDDDWSELWWVRADGHADVLEARPAQAAALVDRYAGYRVTPPAGPWIAINVDRLTAWSAA